MKKFILIFICLLSFGTFGFKTLAAQNLNSELYNLNDPTKPFADQSSRIKIDSSIYYNPWIEYYLKEDKRLKKISAENNAKIERFKRNTQWLLAALGLSLCLIVLLAILNYRIEKKIKLLFRESLAAAEK